MLCDTKYETEACVTAADLESESIPFAIAVGGAITFFDGFEGFFSIGSTTIQKKK